MTDETFRPRPAADVMAALFARGDLQESFDWPEIWQDEHAKGFTVAKSAGFDILKDILDELKESAASGGTGRDFAKRLTPILQEKGWWGRKLMQDPQTGEKRAAQLGSPRRLQIIFDTNMRVSYAAGHWASFERNKAARPFLRYVAILDEDTRPAHRARHNLVLPVDHPYWNLWAPPCGWNCRCTLQSLSQADVNRLVREGEDLYYDPPADTWMTYTNKRTGEVSKVPDGIDPGWAYNPGKAGAAAGMATARKLIDAPPHLSAVAGNDPEWLLSLLQREFENWFDKAILAGRLEPDMVIVGAIRREALDALGPNAQPQSAAISVRRADIRHMIRDSKAEDGKAIPSETLRRMPMLLSNPKAILRSRKNGNLLYVFDAGDKAGKIVVMLGFKTGRRDRTSGKREPVTANMILTASIVPREAVRNAGTYQLLFGEI